MSTATPPTPLHVHGDSMRVGIRLAGMIFTGSIPPDDKVLQVIRTKPAHVVVNEFSLDMLTTISRERSEHRRICAMRAMEILLHQCSTDIDRLQSKTLEKIASKAWELASYMDSEEQVSMTLDTLKPNKEG